jgi:hypothetical protein
VVASAGIDGSSARTLAAGSTTYPVASATPEKEPTRRWLWIPSPANKIPPIGEKDQQRLVGAIITEIRQQYGVELGWRVWDGDPGWATW